MSHLCLVNLTIHIVQPGLSKARATLDQLELLKPRLIVPDHGALGDGSLIQKEKAFLVDARTRALELKRQGASVDDAGATVTADLKAKYPDWQAGNVANIVRRVYEETP